MTTRLFIDGAAGTTGLQIAQRLAGRSAFDLITLDDAQRKDDGARRDALRAADIAILCLPDDAAREAVAMIGDAPTRIIDASTAHRIAPGWTYGLPEVTGTDAVARAARVSNPGCYASGFIALVAPLVRAGLIPADHRLTCNAVSGYSGGGKAMIADYEGAGGSPSAWRTYALGLAHKHLPEMQTHSGLTRTPLFAPAVVPLFSGMVVDVPLHLDMLPGEPTAAMLRDALAAHYAGSPIVSVSSDAAAATIDVEALSGTDRMMIEVAARADDSQARLIAMFDNLGKGASGAAVQSLNLMTGEPETAGLNL